MKKIHTNFHIQIGPFSYDDLLNKAIRDFTKKNGFDFYKYKRTQFPYDQITKKLFEIYSDITFEEFEEKKLDERKVERLKIRDIYENLIYDTVKSDFEPIKLYQNTFLIEMKHFKSFLSKFSECPFFNWNSISSSKYYDWDIECLDIGKDVLNWDELLNKNSTTRDLIKSTNFPKKLYNYLPDDTYFGKYKDHKSIFVIKEYTGNLGEYFRLEFLFRKHIKENYSFIKEIVWLSSYSTPFDLMNQEKLKFDLSDFDYIFAFDIDTNIENSNSNIALKLANEQNLKVFFDLEEMIN